MTEYLNVDVQLGPDQLTEEAFAQMQATFPGWTPDEAAIETLLIRIAAAMASDVAYGLTTATTEIFRYYGESVVGLAPKHSEKATVPSLWQVRDGLGHTIEAGTQVVVPDGVGDYVAFEVIDDLTIAPSAPVTVIPPPASVTMQSVEAGTLGNGLYGPAEANDAIAWLDTVTLTSASTGGTDEESDDDYLNRLRRRLQLMAPRPILPDDFAELALDIPAVYRAMARDGYNPEHNLLTANQASVETDVGDYTVLTACSKTQSAVFSASGSQSLCLTVVGTPSEISCAQTGGTAGRPVTGNQKYTLSAFSRTAATIRPVKIGVNWFTSGGTAIGTTVYGSTLNNSPSNFTARPFVTAVAPSNAAFASIVLNVGGGPLVNNEAHYFDQMALNEGDPLSTWVAGGTPATGNLATVSVALMSATGAALSSPDKTEVVAYLKGLREIGFTVYAIDPSITTINVAYSFKPVTGVDANTVISLIDAALTTYLTGTNWGRNPAVSESTDWVNSNTVRQYELVTLINEIGGVDYVSTVTINGAPSDLAITGPAPTTSVGTIVGTAI